MRMLKIKEGIYTQLSSLVWVGVVAAAFADPDLPTRDSSRFDFKYEMDVLPTEADLDGDGKKDFLYSGGDGSWMTLQQDGVARFDMSSDSRHIVSAAASGADGGAWRRYAPSASEGYTVEVRMRIVSQNKTSTKTIAAALSISEGSGCDSLLSFDTESLGWNESSSNSRFVFAPFATTNYFHTYRIVKIPGQSQFALWCDDNFVTNGLTDALSRNDVNRFIFGAIGGAYGSVVDVDYIRFAKGAYAPKPSRGLDSTQFSHRYEMDLSDARFSPTVDATDWQHFQGEGVSGVSVLSDGILSVDQPKGVMRYWRTRAAMDETAIKGSSFTFEVRLRLKEAWEGTPENDIINFIIGIPGTGCTFNLGKNRVGWRVGEVLKTVHEGDNTDTMHIFRVTQCAGVYTLWRDGVKIGENLPLFDSAQSYVRFGIVSGSSHGGSFEVDYIRWTTEGAFQPYVPPPGMKIIVR